MTVVDGIGLLVLCFLGIVVFFAGILLGCLKEYKEVEKRLEKSEEILRDGKG